MTHKPESKHDAKTKQHKQVIFTPEQRLLTAKKLLDQTTDTNHKSDALQNARQVIFDHTGKDTSDLTRDEVLDVITELVVEFQREHHKKEVHNHVCKTTATVAALAAVGVAFKVVHSLAHKEK